MLQIIMGIFCLFTGHKCVINVFGRNPDGTLKMRYLCQRCHHFEHFTESDIPEETLKMVLAAVHSWLHDRHVH